MVLVGGLVGGLAGEKHRNLRKSLWFQHNELTITDIVRKSLPHNADGSPSSVGLAVLRLIGTSASRGLGRMALIRCRSSMTSHARAQDALSFGSVSESSTVLYRISCISRICRCLDGRVGAGIGWRVAVNWVASRGGGSGFGLAMTENVRQY